MHTKSTIRLDSRRSVSSLTTPGRTMRKESPVSSIVDGGWAYRVRPSSTTSVSADAARPSRSSTVIGGPPVPSGSASITGPGSMRMQSARSGCPGIRSRSRPAPTSAARAGSDSRCTRLSGWSSGTIIDTGPGQQRRAIRRPTAVIRGAQSSASSALLSASESNGSPSRRVAIATSAAAASADRPLAATT